MAQPIRKFTKCVPLKKISQLYKNSLSRQIDIDIDEDDDYIDYETYDGLSVISDEDYTFNIDTSVPEKVSLPPTTGELSNSNVDSLGKSLPSHFDCRLSPLETVCIATVLEEANDKLESIKCLLPFYKNMNTVEPVTVKEKYGTPAPRKLIYPQEAEKPVETQQLKFQRLCQNLATLLRRLNMEIKKESTFTVLRDWIADDRSFKMQVSSILHEQRNNNAAITRFKKELVEALREANDAVTYASQVVSTKDATIHDIKAKAEVEKLYMEGMEAARSQQCQILWEEINKLFQRDLTDARMGVDNEYRVNLEIESYLNMKQNEFTEDLEIWQERYDVDMEERDLALLELKKNREQCMPDMRKDTVKFSKDQDRQMFFFSCYKHKKLEACLMKDVRERFMTDDPLTQEDLNGDDLRSLPRGRKAKMPDFKPTPVTARGFDDFFVADDELYSV